jgi:hypothetical protein
MRGVLVPLRSGTLRSLGGSLAESLAGALAGGGFNADRNGPTMSSGNGKTTVEF